MWELLKGPNKMFNLISDRLKYKNLYLINRIFQLQHKDKTVITIFVALPWNPGHTLLKHKIFISTLLLQRFSIFKRLIWFNQICRLLTSNRRSDLEIRGKLKASMWLEVGSSAWHLFVFFFFDCELFSYWQTSRQTVLSWFDDFDAFAPTAAVVVVVLLQLFLPL